MLQIVMTQLIPCSLGMLQIVMTQLSKGDAATMVATPSDDGHLPLELAAFWGHLDIIKLLIAEG